MPKYDNFDNRPVSWKSLPVEWKYAQFQPLGVEREYVQLHEQPLCFLLSFIPNLFSSYFLNSCPPPPTHTHWRYWHCLLQSINQAINHAINRLLHIVNIQLTKTHSTKSINYYKAYIPFRMRHKTNQSWKVNIRETCVLASWTHLGQLDLTTFMGSVTNLIHTCIVVINLGFGNLG